MLKTRVITAALLAPAALAVLFLFPLTPFLLVVDGVLMLAAWEWSRLAGLDASVEKGSFLAGMAAALAGMHLWGASLPANGLLVFGVLFWLVALIWVLRYPSTAGWSCRAVRVLSGYVVLLPLWIALVVLKQQPLSDTLILMLLLLVWGADIGAYFAGRRFGRNKLAPAVSPGKTREGVYGGLTACAAIGAVFGDLLGLAPSGIIGLILLCLLTGMVSVLGDLFESMFKRHRGIKDSSQLLPGHGGILDRIDSLTAAAPLFVVGVLALNIS